MEQNCKKCGAKFSFTDKELDFYKKLAVPNPTLCKECRRQRRYAFRNERSLYRRKCDGTGQDIISIYSPDKPFKVYKSEYWWSDSWDPMSFGRDFDFSRSFFEQFRELQLKVPRLYSMVLNNVNCDYTNMTSDNKNCYLIFAAENNEDCYYGKLVQTCKDCIDSDFIYNSELLYECVNCLKAYHCFFSVNLENSNDCYFCADLKGCSNCLFSWGLRNKKYYINNKEKTKEEFDAEIKRVFSDPDAVIKAKNDFQELLKNRIVKFADLTKCENVTGDYLKNCKNTYESFDVINGYDCIYLTDACDPVNTHDSSFIYYKPELCYETMSTLKLYNVQFSTYCYYCSNLQYCDHCYNSENCFGCIGLKRGEYCIFNKQYTEKDYEELKSRIIRHMKRTGEYGEFFPPSLSPFGYNETVANDYYPLTKEKALEKGYQWKDKTSPLKDGKRVPPLMAKDASDSIVDNIYMCAECSRALKFIPQEIKFYKVHNLPLPDRCFECRYQSRQKFRTERKLYDRTCQKCRKPIKTAYAESQPEKVYCEECYLKVVE